MSKKTTKLMCEISRLSAECEGDNRGVHWRCLENYGVNFVPVPGYNGTKIVNGETKKQLVFKPDHCFTSSFKNEPEKVELWKEKYNRNPEKYKLCALDTSKYIHIDVDKEDVPAEFKALLNFVPYYKSTTKSYGHHFLVKYDKYGDGNSSKMIKDYGEILHGMWGFIPSDGVIYNANNLDKDFSKLMKLFFKTYTDMKIKKSKKKNKVVKQKAIIQEAKVVENKIIDMDVDMDNIQKMADALPIKPYLTDRNKWRAIIMNLKWEGKYIQKDDDFYYEFAKKLSMKCAEKYDDKGFNSLWYKAKAKDLNCNKKKISQYYQKFMGLNEEVEEATELYCANLFIEHFASDFIVHSVDECRDAIYHYNGFFWDRTGGRRAMLRKIRNELYNFIKEKGISSKLHQTNTQKNVLKQIVEEMSMVKKVEFDKIPYLFAFDNVIFDLRTGEQVEPKRQYYISRTSGYEYEEPNKKLIQKAQDIFSTCFQDDNDEAMLFCGSAIVKKPMRNLLIIWGKRDNGKSFTCDLLQRTCGNFGMKGSHTLFMDKKDGSSHSSEHANLKGISFCWVDECPRIGNNSVKALVANKKTTARQIYQAQAEFSITATFFCPINSMPEVDKKSDGALFEKRFRVYEAKTEFLEKEAMEDAKKFTDEKYIRERIEYEDEELDELRCAIFKLLLPYAKRIVDDKISEVKETEAMKKAKFNLVYGESSKSAMMATIFKVENFKEWKKIKASKTKTPEQEQYIKDTLWTITEIRDALLKHKNCDKEDLSIGKVRKWIQQNSPWNKLIINEGHQMKVAGIKQNDIQEWANKKIIAIAEKNENIGLIGKCLIADDDDTDEEDNEYSTQYGYY